MSFPSVCALLIVKIGQRNKTAALCGRGKVLKECQFENLYIWPYAANSQKLNKYLIQIYQQILKFRTEDITPKLFSKYGCPLNYSLD